MMRSALLLFCLGLLSLSAKPQTVTFAEAEAWVLANHPLAIAAEAVEERGPAFLLAAKGGFDPLTYGSFDRKEYVGTEYYQYTDVGVSWQSPYALKVETGREWAEGVYIANDAFVPEQGQGYLSFKLPVLQGLITDKYRIGVKRGEVAVELNQAAADIIRNELRYDLATRYAQWAYAQRVLEISRQTEDIILQRLSLTRGLYEGGDRPAIDTLEARIALVNQSLVTQLAMAEATIAEQELRAIYFVLPEGAQIPEQALYVDMPDWNATIVNHPELRELRQSFRDLEFERRLKREYLKPQLDLSYSLLGNGFDFTPQNSSGETTLLRNNNKIGITFSYPILNRQARGDLALTDIKLTETGSKLEAKRQSLQTKADAYAAAARTFDAQIAEIERFTVQVQELLNAERELFSLGESTQFLLNSREQSLQKALETQAKLLLSRAKAIYAYRQATASW